MGGGGDHKHKIMDRPFMPKYGKVSPVLLQLVVRLTKFGKIFTDSQLYWYPQKQEQEGHVFTEAETRYESGCDLRC